MAVYSSNSLSYFLSLPVEHKDLLYAIRHWQNLKIGFDGKFVWVKELDSFQADSVEVKSMPYKRLFYPFENRLFPKGSLLPDSIIPSVLWSPIDRGLQIERPSYNHNFFGLNEKIRMSLVPSDQEQEPVALLTPTAMLHRYIVKAPAVRLKNIRWTRIEEQSFLLGFPLLPLQGEVYWRRADFLLPVGFDFEFPLLSPVMNKALNKNKDSLVGWTKQNEFFMLDQQALKPLSISSFRLSV